MNLKFLQQMVVFAAIFLVFQVIYSLVTGETLTPRFFGGLLISTVIATSVYAVFTLIINNRKNRGD